MFDFFWNRKATMWSSWVYIVIGLILVLFPGISGAIFCWGLGIAALVYGAGRLFNWNKLRNAGYKVNGEAVVGVILVLIALVCFFRPASILSFLPLTLGLVLILDGAGKIPLAMEAFRQKAPYSGMGLLSAALPLLLGIVLVMNPFGAAKTVIMAFGVFLLIDGVSDLLRVYYWNR
ncbi:MAG TPA: DUF308 domain-containing protein [Candidatus Choladousia intestinigallinarum]|nr:DUF308 domain-containing protein [Candidatus Choladousia intestinigallinarum]